MSADAAIATETPPGVTLYHAETGRLGSGPSENCNWTENETDGHWEGTCGLAWEFTAGTPESNGFLYCPRCARRVHTANDELRHGGENL
jgi:hypothetical protein